MHKPRRAGLAVVPAVLAAMTLSACQDAAPTAAPPTAASQPPSPSQTQQPAPSTTEPPAPAPSTTEQPAPAPSTTEPPAPAPTSAPSSSAAPGSGSGGQCNDTGVYRIKRGSVAAKPLATTQPVKDSGGAADIAFGQPTIDTSSGDSFFPGEGMQTVIYPVTIKVTEGSYVSSRLKFGLTDPAGKPCTQDVMNAVVSEGDQLDIDLLQSGETVTKKLVWAVPAGADLSKYALVYKEDYPGDADLAWTAK